MDRPADLFLGNVFDVIRSSLSTMSWLSRSFGIVETSFPASSLFMKDDNTSFICPSSKKFEASVGAVNRTGVIEREGVSVDLCIPGTFEREVDEEREVGRFFPFIETVETVKLIGFEELTATMLSVVSVEKDETKVQHNDQERTNTS